MALALDATSSGQAITQTSLTISHTCSGSDRILIVGIAAGSSDIVTGVTYNSVAMTRVPTNGVQNNGNSTAYMYYLLAPTTGANNIVITTSVAAVISADAASFTGASSTQPDASVKNTASATNLVANTLTTVADNTIHVAAYAIDANAVTSVTNGTLINRVIGYSALITPAGSHTLTGNSSGGNNAWATVGISITPGTQPGVILSGSFQFL